MNTAMSLCRRRSWCWSASCCRPSSLTCKSTTPISSCCATPNSSKVQTWVVSSCFISKCPWILEVLRPHVPGWIVQLCTSACLMGWGGTDKNGYFSYFILTVYQNAILYSWKAATFFSRTPILHSKAHRQISSNTIILVDVVTMNVTTQFFWQWGNKACTGCLFKCVCHINTFSPNCKCYLALLIAYGLSGNQPLSLSGDKTKVQKLVQMAWTFVNDRWAGCCIVWQSDLHIEVWIFLWPKCFKYI